MKNYTSRINPLIKHPKFLQWVKLIAVTGGVQTLVQSLGLLSGILIIRLMPVKEYAWYTIANTMLGTLTLLSDAGISTGVMSQGGRVWQDKRQLSIVLATGLYLRRRFAIGSLVVSIPILGYLLIHQNASYLTTFFIILSIIPAFLAALSDNLLEIPFKLHQNIIPLQKNQLYTSIARLLLMCGMLFIFPFTALALIGNGLPRLWANRQLVKLNNIYIDWRQKHDNGHIKKDILVIVKRILPGAVYYCFSGQITIWLVSFFGNSSSIAEIGALGRLAILLSIISTMFSTLIVPRFARLANKKSVLLKKYFQILFLLVLSSLLITTTVKLFPEILLWVLGKNYTHLGNELFLCIIGSCISLLWGSIFGLYSSRGWILQPYVSIFISIMPIVIWVIFFDVKSITGVLYMNIVTSSIQLLMHFSYGLYKIFKVTNT